MNLNEVVSYTRKEGVNVRRLRVQRAMMEEEREMGTVVALLELKKIGGAERTTLFPDGTNFRCRKALCSAGRWGRQPSGGRVREGGNGARPQDVPMSDDGKRSVALYAGDVSPVGGEFESGGTNSARN